MDIKTYSPAESLEPFVKKYLILETEEERVNNVFPEGSLAMALRFRGEVDFLNGGSQERLPPAALSGLRKSRRLIRYSAKAGNILVIFREGAAGAFFKEPLHELAGQSVPLEYLEGYKTVSRLEERLAESAGHEVKIRLVEDFLLSALRRPQVDQAIFSALQYIRSAHGTIRVAHLADVACLSRDAFEKRFRKVVGLPPKTYSYLIRMRSVLNSSLTEGSLAETALNWGYFDQPHFNRDFKNFTGQTPTEFLKSPRFW